MSRLSDFLDRWCEKQRKKYAYTPLVGSTRVVNTERFYPLWKDEVLFEAGFLLGGGHPLLAAFNVFLHKWVASDVGMPHNHPRLNITLVLSGNLVEVCGRRV